MKIVGIKESKIWFNKITKQRVSIYGALPWTRECDKDQWEMRSQGWTWEMSNGAVGFGRAPAATKGEAERVMEAFNARREIPIR
jgi:hypothetical protein